ncbi:MAG TPA: HDIG domain-containing protein [Chitinophagaceae bacterium]|jgi:putative nucleotidyltransferase with HDIG domain|nr:HDIG domain-containing protein [Chitinophagaceae bacterium]
MYNTQHIDEITAEIQELFEDHGNEDYDGEPVTQTSHMIQCAMQAMAEGADMELIIGGFLHDIGHLLRYKMQTEDMGGYGVMNHDGLGGEYLRGNGFSERVCAMVEQHVAAKRYLVSTNPSYKDKLSQASLETLMKWQGGLMTKEEITAFQNQLFFNDIIKVRLWDEEAKDSKAVLLPLKYFINLIHEYLADRN